MQDFLLLIGDNVFNLFVLGKNKINCLDILKTLSELI